MKEMGKKKDGGEKDGESIIKSNVKAHIWRHKHIPDPVQSETDERKQQHQHPARAHETKETRLKRYSADNREMT